VKEFTAVQRIDRLGIFTYSHEENTSAYGLTDDVPADEKPAAWLKLLRERYSDFRGAVNRTFHGTDSELRRASGDLVEALQRVQETLRELSA
jgi:tRNA A37 methylthiotransferase MiaB